MAADGVIIALDVGATGIKTVTAEVSGDHLALRDIKSTATLPRESDGCSYVDIGRIIGELTECVRSLGDERILSAGIDTFGNGYGFLDGQGELIALPYDYRDRRVGGILEEVHRHFTDRQLYDLVGNFPFRSRGLFHLYRDVLDQTDNIRRGSVMLPLPNLIEYLLTGNMLSERTICSVLYMLDSRGENWNAEAFGRLGIPMDFLIPVTEPGRRAGIIRSGVPEDVKSRRIPLINVIGHDTESALITVPSMNEKHLFACLGTSFIFGTRPDHPVITDQSFGARFKNMRGAFGKYSLCKDFPGFWLLEQCMEEWRKSGSELTYEQVSRMARSVNDNETWLNLNDERFRIYGNIFEKVRSFCEGTGQIYPQDQVHMAACLFESYCLFIRWNAQCLGIITGEHFEVLDAFNGGVRNSVLMQMLSDCLQMKVAAHGKNASACGNILMQYAVLTGKRHPAELEKAAEDLSEPRMYRPDPAMAEYWNRRYEQFTRRVIRSDENGQSN